MKYEGTLYESRSVGELDSQIRGLSADGFRIINVLDRSLHAGGIAEIVEEPEVMAPERGKFPWVPVIIGAIILGSIVCYAPEPTPEPTPGGGGGC